VDLRWFLLGFALASLALGLRWRFGEDEAIDPHALDDPLDRRPDPAAAALKRVWNKAFWNNRVSLLVVAVVMTPLGGFVAAPILGGRAAEMWARRAGRTNSVRWGVAVGVVWLVLALALVIPASWLAAAA